MRANIGIVARLEAASDDEIADGLSHHVVAELARLALAEIKRLDNQIGALSGLCQIEGCRFGKNLCS